MVYRILEGLREEAFELARDIGIESLTAPGGLRAFMDKMRSFVFPKKLVSSFVRTKGKARSHTKAARACHTPAVADGGGTASFPG